MGAAKKKPDAIPTKLTPVPGSNPEKQPVPRDDALDRFYSAKVVHPELCYVTSRAVGHAVSLYWGGSDDPRLAEASRGLMGFKGTAYQVMRWNEGPGRGLEFWDWHLCERPRRYPTPEAACAASVASYTEWIKEHPDQP